MKRILVFLLIFGQVLHGSTRFYKEIKDPRNYLVFGSFSLLIYFWMQKQNLEKGKREATERFKELTTTFELKENDLKKVTDDLNTLNDKLTKQKQSESRLEELVNELQLIENEKNKKISCLEKQVQTLQKLDVDKNFDKEIPKINLKLQDEVGNLKRDVKTRDEELSRLQKTIGQKNNEMDVLRKQCLELGNRKSDDQKILDLQNNLDKAYALMRIEQKKNSEFEFRIKSLENQLKEAKNEVEEFKKDKLASKLKEAEVQVRSQNNTIEDLKKQIEILKNYTAGEISDLKRESEETLKRVKQELEEKLQREIEQKNSELDSKKREFDLFIKTKNSEIEDLQKVVAFFRSGKGAKEISEDVKELQIDHIKFFLELEGKKQEKEDLEIQFKLELEKLENEKNAREEELKRLKEELLQQEKKQKKKIDSLTNRVDTTTKEKEILKKDNKKYGEEIQAKENYIANLQKQSEVLLNGLNENRENLDKEKKKTFDLQTRICEYQKNFEEKDKTKLEQNALSIKILYLSKQLNKLNYQNALNKSRFNNLKKLREDEHKEFEKRLYVMENFYKTGYEKKYTWFVDKKEKEFSNFLNEYTKKTKNLDEENKLFQKSLQKTYENNTDEYKKECDKRVKKVEETSSELYKLVLQHSLIMKSPYIGLL